MGCIYSCVTCYPCIHHSTLDGYDWFNTKPYFPQITRGKVIKVYDGDTIWVVSKIHGNVYRFNIRMYGYNSPELRDKNPLEQKKAVLARDFLKDLINNKMIDIRVIPEKEKYGRILAYVYHENKCINNLMIENGHGVPYYLQGRCALQSPRPQ